VLRFRIFIRAVCGAEPFTSARTETNSDYENKKMQSLNDLSMTSELVRHELGEGLNFFVTSLPDPLRWNGASFDSAWSLRPAHDQFIKIHGRQVRLPRAQQAFGADYHYSGIINQALPVPSLLRPLLKWAQTTIVPALNGLLLNWYEGKSQYIGTHRDSIRELIPGTPIVTISFGETRLFRLTRGKAQDKTVRDFMASDGSVFVMPWATNRAWYHEVVKRANYTGKRISVTLRAFANGVLSPEKYFAD
jgi:alkylated DNA repair dioxygenase AlkB